MLLGVDFMEIMFLILHLLCVAQNWRPTSCETSSFFRDLGNMNHDDCDDAVCSILTVTIFNPNTVPNR